MPSGNSIPRERPRVTQLRGRIVDSFPLVRRAIRSPLSSRDEHLREESTRREGEEEAIRIVGGRGRRESDAGGLIGAGQPERRAKRGPAIKRRRRRLWLLPMADGIAHVGGCRCSRATPAAEGWVASKGKAAGRGGENYSANTDPGVE